MRHIVVFIPEFQRDESVEALRFILQLAEALHMVHPVPELLDVAVEHGGVGNHAHLVCCAVNVPAIRPHPPYRGRSGCGYRDGRSRRRPGKGLQAGLFHHAHTFFHAHFRFAEHVIQLHGRKAFDVQVRTVGLDAAHQFHEKVEVHFGMHAANDVHFGNGLVVVFLHDVQHLVYAEFPAVLPVFVKPGVRAEFAGEHANVGGLYMEIAVEVSFVAV